ncbi:GrpE, mitochondrial [Coemansia sp. RSA 2167]|nr:GrpE, mitochondrial [Coemansia sp. RSA 1591]KAJ1764637.1 GrpE, mitochondrial [Coemansia sp. RSA 1752]KAJ1791218.1 GrpE, mitochondrial [Coemansia sp. RSA 2167]KAJ1793993.1 GrpE, mitochondrial [Coemansia sp. RSA 1938]KAJ2170515.1 GrpE, mitochondrial [Coemansia sp. RSA 560]KAJ2214651.1 GrpE, mitochondrial [Coemansia sp. RSA 520]KAJ2428464.1 GrpE, mitochondrial [Coemansia sp. RSA 2522]KAJ2531018.1 GrpE, mitochondrial [Coemansia sp. RSA 1935]KAJ2714074.1 GrpE, mitochondrial [Coemansia sp. D17
MIRSVFAGVCRTPFVAASRATTYKAPALVHRFYSDQATPETESAQPASSANSAEAKQEAEAAPAISAQDVEKLKQTITEKDAKLKELKDAYLRSLADAENIRTRAKTEVDNTKTFAIQKFAKDLLDTVDILELAIKHVPQEHLADKVANKSLADLYEGVDMTKSNLLRTLERHGVESFDPMDQPYDPNTSHALYQAPIPGKTPGHVFAVEKRGYVLKGRVLRSAQVGVVLDTSDN